MLSRLQAWAVLPPSVILSDISGRLLYALQSKVSVAAPPLEKKVKILTSPTRRSGAIHSREFSCPEFGRCDPSMALDRPAAQHHAIMSATRHSSEWQSCMG